MKISSPHFTAIVLAADRESVNPVAKAAGVRCKSLAPVNGIPMVFGVMAALSSARNIKDQILCGPPEPILNREDQLKAQLASGNVRWIENKATPSASAYHVMQSLAPGIPVLLTTSDHALLTAQMVDYFCVKALSSGCDVVAAVALHKAVTAAYPETHRTAYRLNEGAYCACNLFAFLTPRGRSAAYFWHRVEQQRKRPLRVISVFGWMTVIRYLTRRLTLSQALNRISHRLGFKSGVVIMPFPEAAIDVDSVDDWQQVQRIAAGKTTDALKENRPVSPLSSF
ncbi:MAG: nucleotidyltransferase family protein [Desulfobacterales bacterium]|jgi:CTP:molybdopterin cytidylyltransferase MocA|nr:nucleotidyltransferase family protein [Desulfobacterales bacterium]